MGLFSKKHSIGKTISELRKEKGWTQIELAEKLQVSDKTISKWEQDSGAPSIEFFPILAEVFGVSIDYLMTGKKAEPEIITMSKAELCAKNDDVSLVKDINLTTTDENGKTLIDYIIQYNSYNVFSAICDEKRFISLQGTNSNNVKKFEVLKLIEFALITNKISVLDRGFVLNNCSGVDDIKGLLHIEDYDNFKNLQGSGAKYACILTDKVLDIIVQDKRVKPDTILYLLSNQKKRECVWYLVLPYLLHQSYLHNNMKLFNMILNASISSNQYAYDKMPIKYDSYYGYNYELRYFMIASKNGYGNIVHGLVRALEKTIKLALERSDIETVEKLNNLNTAVMEYYGQFKCYIATADEIRVSKLKSDKTVSKDELAIQSTIHNGIVCIDELLELKDFKTIKSTLEKYPIHQLELLYNMFNENKIRELFQKAIDNKDTTLANIVVKNNKELILKHILSYSKGDNINKKHLYYTENGRKVELFSQTYGMYNSTPLTIVSVLEKLNLCKQRIIEDLSLKMDKEKTVGELTKEYFENELAKGNTDMVVIKLCVRLEAILRCDYHYEGDFVDMLNKYCSHFNTYDDEGNDYDPYTPKMLNKLRMQRNGIVHSEKCNESLTIDELKWCIDYICKMR